MAMKNYYTLTLCHMSPAEKKAYNANYYRSHQNYWKDYYSVGKRVGRPKYVTEGNGQGVKRRGSGLGTGPVGTGRNGKKRTVGTNDQYGNGQAALEAWANVVDQTGDDLDSFAYNHALDISNQDTSGWYLPAVQEYVDAGGGSIYDNAIYAIAEANGIVARGAKKGKEIAKSLAKSWQTGMNSVRKMFKKKRK